MTATGQPEAEPSSESKPNEERAADENAKRQRLDLYSVRLRADQITFLKNLPNASEWLRAAIDDARAKDPITSTSNRVLLLCGQLRDMDQQMKLVAENPMYLEAKSNLSRIQGKKNAMDAAVKFSEEVMSGAYDKIIEEDRLNRLPESVHIHLDYLDPPDQELMKLWHSITNLHWSLTQRDGREPVGHPSLFLKGVKSSGSTFLPDLIKTQTSLGEQEAKEKTIVAGFEAEIKALAEKRLKVERDLLEAGRVMEAAESQDGASAPGTETS